MNRTFASSILGFIVGGVYLYALILGFLCIDILSEESWIRRHEMMEIFIGFLLGTVGYFVMVFLLMWLSLVAVIYPSSFIFDRILFSKLSGSLVGGVIGILVAWLTIHFILSGFFFTGFLLWMPLSAAFITGLTIGYMMVDTCDGRNVEQVEVGDHIQR